MNNNDVQRFNNWFSNNYSTLQKYCKKYRIAEDYINTVYISTHDRIVKSGYTESYFLTYVKRSIRNLRINEAKNLNGRHYIDYDNEDYTNIVETTLQEIDDCDKDTQQYREDVILFSKMLFKFIDEKFKSDEWKFIFRSYYIMPGRMTYTKLTAMTGYNKNHCTKVIQTMKKEINVLSNSQKI